MSGPGTLGHTAAGVIEELVTDVGDVAWGIFDLVGVSPIFNRLRNEIQRQNTVIEIDELTGETRYIRKRKSIVRILGSALPLKPVSRPYLR